MLLFALRESLWIFRAIVSCIGSMSLFTCVVRNARTGYGIGLLVAVEIRFCLRMRLEKRCSGSKLPSSSNILRRDFLGEVLGVAVCGVYSCFGGRMIVVLAVIGLGATFIFSRWLRISS